VNSEVNSRRVQNVEQCFGSSGQSLSSFGRVLVGEGILIKMCRKGPKQRQFFLFNDILVYGNILIAKKRYNRQHIIPLEDVCIEDVADEGQLRNGWLIRTPSKSFAVYAATPTEKREWMMHMERSVEDLLVKNKKSPPPTLAAVWVPDSEAVRCMSCGRTHFNFFFQRRHHCRACGNVVCRACSSHSLKISSLKKGPVRVCDQCFVKLSSVEYNDVKESSNRLMNSQQEEREREGREGERSDSSAESDDDMANDDYGPTFYREETTH
ncbi:hypothetical protein PENTCL1PPCAC_17866, partial [Pristionchus entomophagus]